MCLDVGKYRGAVIACQGILWIPSNSTPSVTFFNEATGIALIFACNFQADSIVSATLLLCRRGQQENKVVTLYQKIIMRILKENTLGLVIDYQERLLPHIYENQQLLENSMILIEGLKALEIPLFVTEQYRKGLGITTPEIKNLFSPFKAMEKVSFSCFDDQGFGQALAHIDKQTVVICGIEAHVCILQTAIDLLENNYLPVVVGDCISSRKPQDKQTAIKRMRQAGVIITSYESILFELCRVAGTDQFRAISKLVK